MKKKILCTFIAVLMFASSAYAQNIKISVNDKNIQTDTSSEIKDGTVFVPISFIAGGLGADIKWEDSKAVLTMGDDTYIFIPGSTTAYKNNNAYVLKNAAYISNSRTLVPLEAINELLGCSADYDDKTGLIKIDSAGDDTAAASIPEIALENHASNFVILPLSWNGITSDADIYTAVLDSDTADTNIYRPQVNELFKFTFSGSVPDKVSVSMTYYGERNNEYPEESVPIFKNGKTFEFLDQPIPDSDSSWGSRIYIIKAAWGENVCQYAFITDNKSAYSALEDLGQRMKDLHAIDYCIIDNYVYYAVLGDKEGFHRMLLDGTEDKRICDFSGITSSLNGSTRIELLPQDDNSILCEIQQMQEYNGDGTLTGPFPIDYYRIDLSNYKITKLDKAD